MYAERIRLALKAAAEAKSDAERLEKVTKRVFSQLVISGDGAVSMREHVARAHERYIAIEDQHIAAKTKANLLEAEAEAMRLTFEEWRSSQATAREEMKLR